MGKNRHSPALVGTYVAMENLGGNVGNFSIGGTGVKALFGKYALTSIIAEELTPEQVEMLTKVLQGWVNTLP